MNAVDWLQLRQFGAKGAQRVKCINDANGICIYSGFAPRGSLTSDPAWVISKLTYDVNGAFLEETTSPENSIFDNYLSLTYA